MPDDPQLFDRFATEYDFAATLWRDHSFFLDRLPERRARALDVGCGSGGLVEALAPHFDSVRGVDISEPMLAIAREKRSNSNVEYALGNADSFEGIEAVPGGYDFIVSHTMCLTSRTRLAPSPGCRRCSRPAGAW